MGSVDGEEIPVVDLPGPRGRAVRRPDAPAEDGDDEPVAERDHEYGLRGAAAGLELDLQPRSGLGAVAAPQLAAVLAAFREEPEAAGVNGEEGREQKFAAHLEAHEGHGAGRGAVARPELVIRAGREVEP